MATSFNGTFSIVSDFTYGSNLDLGVAAYTVKNTEAHKFVTGELANQAEQVFTDSRTLGSSSTEDLDLSGSLTNALNETIVFTSIKVIVVKADSANTDDLVIGGQGVNGFSTFFGDATDQILVKPGGSFALIAPDAGGYAVTAGTGDLLQIDNSGGASSVTYEITLVGTE